MRPSPHPSITRNVLLSVFALTGIVLAYFVARFNFLTDDAFILFRYSKNFADGFGLVYNPGTNPPVEGYSEFLWAVLLGAVEWLHLDVTIWSRVLTVAGSFATLFVLLDFARRKFRLGIPALLATGLFFATNPTVGVWSTSGLSTSLFVLSIFVFFSALFLDEDNPRGIVAGVAGVATSLLRADGPYWIVCIGIVAILGFLWRRRADRGQAPVVGIFAPGPFRTAVLQTAAILAVCGGIFLAWRLHTYGDYLPNTARAKVGMTALSLERGTDYLLSYWAMLPVVPVVFGIGLAAMATRILKGSRAALGAMDAATLAVAATFIYSLLVGGDFMAMGRFFLPAAPFLALLFGVSIEKLIQARLAIGIALFSVGIFTNVQPSFGKHLVPKSVREQLHFRWTNENYSNEFNYWRGMSNRCAQWAQVGRALKLHAKPTDSLVLVPIGAIGYYSGMVIFDSMGLTNKQVLEASEPGTKRSSPGHDRLVPMQFFDRYEPTYRQAKLLPLWTKPADIAALNADPKVQLIELREEDGFAPGSILLLRKW
ncbi:MAG: hypothetical protein ACJAVJ_002571 [Planctomycetota bacterium]|jgi:hypothetical protein